MDSSEYELVRNLTLLFFFERLMDKGGPRTLHDLSCQFGARGFTKEMRQIAGGSQSGLRKFLAQYPTLFIINGDYVAVNTFEAVIEEDAGMTKLNKRDYVQEAVEYFSDKLVQYGIGAEVPIKSLLGHRSQASPEVRHISGQHYREFRDFLLKYSSDFIVCDENVKLKKFEGMQSVPFKELEPEIPVDQEMTTKLLDFFVKIIEQKSPMSVEQLLHMVSDKYPGGMWTTMFTTPEDLMTFLKMFPDAFNVQKKLVTLHDKPKLSVDNTQMLETKNSTLRKINDSENKDIHRRNSQTCMTKFTDQVFQSESNSIDNQIRYSVSVTDDHQSSIESYCNSPPVSLQQLTLKQRINTLVMKTIADNTEKDRNLQTPYFGDTWKLKIVQQTKVIVNLRESARIIDDIMNSQPSSVDGKVVVSFDCEGINVGAKGQLTLVVIGTIHGSVYIFDLFTSPNLINGLQKILESSAVVKVGVELFQAYGTNKKIQHHLIKRFIYFSSDAGNT